jgi:myo-inositol-1(or 4)-monophosphatase
MSDFVSVCEKAARAGGKVLLDWQGRFGVKEKGPADLVTEADLASEKCIREIVLGEFPDHQFIGEEDQFSGDDSASGGVGARSDSPYRWLVDPLDGTTNYVHQFPIYSVSVALERAGKVIAATVFNPVDGQCYVAAAGQGAHLNGERLSASRVSRLHEALVAVSFGPRTEADSDEVARFLRVLPRCQAIRRFGSAALNLCYLAAGRIDVYWASTTKVWDIAAGVLMAQEAGAIVTGLDGSPFDLANPRFAAAATQPLYDELISTFSYLN